jgi:hypothetical protein
MNKSIILILFLLIATFSIAQNETGDVNIIQDVRIDTLLSKHKTLSEYNPDIEGWRIEIFFESGNNSKRLAIEAQSEFISKYTETPTHLIFQAPYYKVRVGDYRTRLEAEAFLKRISGNYPNAFVVKDEIDFPKLGKTEVERNGLE